MAKAKKKKDIVAGDNNFDNFFPDDEKYKENYELINIGEYDETCSLIYAVNVNLARMLKNIRDGLLPVERRILYAMFMMKVFPKSPFKKVAKIVGEVMGEYHPHGDSPIASSLGKLGQSWKMNEICVHGHGNFGSAAGADIGQMRYIEAKLSKYAMDCFFEDGDWDGKSIVDFAETFQGKGFLEPEFLPSKYCNALIQWSTGIGNGIYSGLPGHRVVDVNRAIIKLLDNPDADFSLIPDTPTGCTICDKKKFLKMSDALDYTFRMRSNYEVDGKYVYIRNVPFNSTANGIRDQIEKLYEAGKLPELVNAEVDDVDFGRKFTIVLTTKKGADIEQLMSNLYKWTQLEDTFTAMYNMVDDYSTYLYTARTTMLNWIMYRKEYLMRKQKSIMSNLAMKIHVNEGQLEILTSDRFEDVIKFARKHSTSETERFYIDEFGMSDVQARKISQLRLGELNQDNINKLKDENKDLEKKYNKHKKILTSDSKLNDIIREDQLDGIKRYGTPRKSKVVQLKDISNVPNTRHKLVITTSCIKKLDVSLVDVGDIDPSDKILSVMDVKNRDTVLVFDKAGKVYPIKVSNINVSPADNVGISLTNFGIFEPVIGCVSYNEEEEGLDKKLITVTHNGLIKKSDINDYYKLNKPTKSISLNKEDYLVSVHVAMDNTDVIVYTTDGNAIVININEITETSRNTKGVKALNLVEGENIIGICELSDGNEMVVFTTKGRAKRFPCKGMPTAKRGNTGFPISKLEKNEKIFTVMLVKDTDMVEVMTRDNKLFIEILDIVHSTRIAPCEKIVKLPKGDYILEIIKISGEIA
jgi:DNA gyrase subunit A